MTGMALRCASNYGQRYLMYIATEASAKAGTIPARQTSVMGRAMDDVCPSLPTASSRTTSNPEIHARIPARPASTQLTSSLR